MLTVPTLITQYKLLQHPEGGYYSQTYKSEEIISKSALPDRFKGDRNFSTAIYFLLEGTQFSAFHRIESDELWHFYTGTSLHIYIIHRNGRGELLKLGNDISNGDSFQHMVPAGCWFASKPVFTDGFSFVGCTVSPGFDFEDFELADKKKLLQEFPQHDKWIHELCK